MDLSTKEKTRLFWRDPQSIGPSLLLLLTNLVQGLVLLLQRQMCFSTCLLPKHLLQSAIFYTDMAASPKKQACLLYVRTVFQLECPLSCILSN